MATHSSILAWKIPWTEDHGRLQALWSQTVSGHGGATNIFTSNPYSSIPKHYKNSASTSKL